MEIGQLKPGDRFTIDTAYLYGLDELGEEIFALDHIDPMEIWPAIITCDRDWNDFFLPLDAKVTLVVDEEIHATRSKDL